MITKDGESLLAPPERLQAVGLISGRIAHELNNYLTPLAAYLPMVRESLPADASERELVDAMEKCVTEMTGMARRLMSLASVESKRKSTADVVMAIEKALAQIKREHSIGDIEIEIERPQTQVEIEAVPEKVREVVENLCLNGFEAMDSGSGRLTVGIGRARFREEKRTSCGLCLAAGNYVRISVSDTGSGVPDQVRDRMFEPCVSSKKASGQRHSGLGLAVAYRIMQDHSGGIDFESSPGKGARFDLYFPCTYLADGSEVMEEQASNEENDESHALIARDKSRILIVDDERSIVKLFQMILSMGLPGTMIDVASNGAEAVECFTKWHHGAVLMDLHMPVMDGQTAYSRIEKVCMIHEWEMPCVLFCTGFAPPDTVTQIVEGNPAHHILQKPVTGQVLIDAIKARLA